MTSNTHRAKGFRDLSFRVGQWAAVSSLFAVPLNKPATNIALVLGLLGSMCGRDVLLRWQCALRQPVAQGAIAWACVLTLSALHTWFAGDGFPIAGSFVGALFYPLLFGTLLETPVWRRRGLLAFALGVGLVLLISYGMYLGLVPQRDVAQAPGAPMRNTVFKEYTQQGLAVLMLGCMAVAFGLTGYRSRLLCFGVAALALIDAALLLQSRTVFLVLAPLLCYWVWRLARTHLNWRFAGVAGIVVALVLALAWFTSPVRERVAGTILRELPGYVASREPSSTGIRLELWRQTLTIISTAPVWGHGLGEWKPLYRQAIEPLPNFNQFLMGHPHQEMLLILSEQGVAGLLVYLVLLVALARYITRLNPPERDVYACLLLAYLSAGLVNCLWADFSHRHLLILLLACIPLADNKPLQMRVPGSAA
jgi:O-antigen ligase